MPCYSPLTAWRGPMLPSGKRSVVFKPTQSTGGLVAFPQKLPCGQCVGCRLDYSLDWATRCLFEAQMHKENCFVTLTFDDKNLPKDKSLDVRCWQLFMKRLRKEVGKVRFYHAGEYGEEFGRPHYHGLLFGYNFPDRVYFKNTASGSRIDTSLMLSRLWQFGYSSVGDVTFESAAYVARYCMKKVTGKAAEAHYERVDMESGEIKSLKSEYVTMSRRPGIAKAWYEKYKSDVYPHGYCVVKGGVKMPPPRYFDSQYELTNPDEFAMLKKERIRRSVKMMSSEMGRKFDRYMVEDYEYTRLPVKEEVKQAQLRMCQKKLESGQ